MNLYTAVSAGCRITTAARKGNNVDNDNDFSLELKSIWRRSSQRGRFPGCRPHRWRDFMGKKKRDKKMPTRFVVERVYSGTESMERALTSVSEEAARRNVEERLKEKKTA